MLLRLVSSHRRLEYLLAYHVCHSIILHHTNSTISQFEFM